MTTLKDKLTSTPEGRRLYQREEMAQALTDTICELVKRKGVSRAELARRMGKSEGVVSYYLDRGTAIFQSLSGYSDIFTALDSRVVFTVEPL